MNKQSTKLNIVMSVVLQLVTLISGLIIPRLVLDYFGSEVNGLVSSLNQFLNYITLLEGGVTGVIMASLYKPLAENDRVKVSGIIKATEGFFRKVSIIFIGYSLAVGVLYPLLVNTSFTWIYVFSFT